MKKWRVVILLALAQFVMVLDSTVMNVSISTLVTDLNTTINGIQSAITFYTLTMAAFMLTGGKFGEKWGSKKIFIIGSLVYGLGSFLTAISPGLPMLLFGWSLVEGLGAIMVIPAIAALIAANYHGKDRALAYGILGAVAGAGAAVGPLIGGIATTYFSWRYVFLGETLVMLALLPFMRYLVEGKIKSGIKIDILSVVLSAAGLGVLVFGILQSKVWGWVDPLAIPQIAGYPIAPFGISVVAYLIVAGLALLWSFYDRQKQLARRGQSPLLDTTLFSILPFRSGINAISLQYFITGGAFFVLPVYLQMYLGLDALQTGLKIMPLSLALVVCAVVGSKLADKLSLRFLVRIAFILAGLGLLSLMSQLAISSVGPGFDLGMMLIGAGLGLLSSQIGNIILSSVPATATNQAGGVQGTFQNLGTSLGTALIGTVLISSLTSNFDRLIGNANLPSSVTQQLTALAAKGLPIVSLTQAQQILDSSGLDAQVSEAIFTAYQSSQLHGLQVALFFLALIVLVAFPLTRHVPKKL